MEHIQTSDYIAQLNYLNDIGPGEWCTYLWDEAFSELADFSPLMASLYMDWKNWRWSHRYFFCQK